MKKVKAKILLAAILPAALLIAAIAIQGCGSESYDTSGVKGGPSSLTCGGSSTGVVSSIFINEDAPSTQSATVKLMLHAEDPDNVAAYFVSESNVTPTADAAGWVAAPAGPCTVLDGSGISFTVESAPSPGQFTRTVYVWFKDGLNNVSEAASDSINLIKAADAC